MPRTRSTIRRVTRGALEVDALKLMNEEFVAHSDTFKSNRDGSVSVEGRAIVQLKDADGQWYVGERVVRIRAKRHRSKAE